MVYSEEIIHEPQQGMTPAQAERYEQIQAFVLDHPQVEFPFSQRLAKENNWTLNYTQRVIDEYKKFAFLAVEAGHPVSPSDQIDQVWHLHLSYTRSYWESFCPDVLGTSLHHEPTQGGAPEKEKFEDWYRQTLESYERFFEQAPPADIWPSPETRFSQDLSFVRVNTQQYWVVLKSQAETVMTLGASAVFAVFFSGFAYSRSSHMSWLEQGGLVLICVVAGFEFIKFLIRFIRALNDPTPIRGYGGCGVGGCGGCGGCGGDYGGGCGQGCGGSCGGGCGGGCGG